MRLPHVRFTVRRMMVVVAIVGALLGFSVRLMRQAQAYGRLAGYHAASKSSFPPPWLIETDIPSYINSRGEMISNRRHHWHEAMQAKYRDAARYPWLPVEPDPPEPP